MELLKITKTALYRTFLGPTFLGPTFLLAAVMLIGGCRICADCEDTAYPAYGGSWQRTIRETGRVGSLFDPAGGKAPNLTSRDQPEHADQLERHRYKAKGSGVRDPEETEETVPEDSKTNEERFRERQNELRDLELHEIDSPKEREQQQKRLEEIGVRVIKGEPAPPLL